MLARLLTRPLPLPLRSLALTLASSSSLLQPPQAATPVRTLPPRFPHSRPFSTDNRGGGGDNPPGGSWNLTPDAEDADPLFPSDAADLPGIEPEIFGGGGGAGEEENLWSQPEQEEKGDIFDGIIKGEGEVGVGGDEWETAEGYKPWSLEGGDEETVDLFDGIEVGGIDGLGDGAVDEEAEKAAEEEEKRNLEMREKVLLQELKGPERAFGDLIEMSGITEDMICSLILLKDVRNVPGLPPLSEIQQKAIDKHDVTSSRGDIERRKQEEITQARVRKVDEKGRAYGTGRRKCSIARVWIQTGDGKFTVNEKPFDSYFPILDHRATLLDPFSLTNTLGLWNITSTVKGGGVSGQVGAIRLGICRALQNWEPGFRPYLKSAGYLTRDPRVVERKKPGKAKARKSFQWVKR